MASRLAGSIVPYALVPRNFCSRVLPVWRKWNKNSSIRRDSESARKICSSRSMPHGRWFCNLGAGRQPCFSPKALSSWFKSATKNYIKVARCYQSLSSTRKILKEKSNEQNQPRQREDGRGHFPSGRTDARGQVFVLFGTWRQTGDMYLLISRYWLCRIGNTCCLRPLMAADELHTMSGGGSAHVHSAAFAPAKP